VAIKLELAGATGHIVDADTSGLLNLALADTTRTLSIYWIFFAFPQSNHPTTYTLYLYHIENL